MKTDATPELRHFYQSERIDFVFLSFLPPFRSILGILQFDCAEADAASKWQLVLNNLI